jgi:uncharacterized protein YciI|tara:strand:- start:240 stop:569 length:330 start_codon:yes stop_codon:yes gene_type:complete
MIPLCHSQRVILPGLEQKASMARFVLWGTYCENALEKRTPFRDEHLSRLKTLQEQGTLITLGPTQASTHVFGIFEAANEQQLRDLLEQDVYWRQGIWTALEVYPWIQAF